MEKNTMRCDLVRDRSGTVVEYIIKFKGAAVRSLALS